MLVAVSLFQIDLSLLQIELSLLKMTSLATSRECKKFCLLLAILTLGKLTRLADYPVIIRAKSVKEAVVILAHARALG